MAELTEQARAEVTDAVGRARAAAAAIADYSQEQVDELVTAVAWSVVRKDNAEALARLAVDEGGFGNYADKVTKINKRVTGVLNDMRTVRTVGVVEESPELGLVKIAKPVGVVAALIPTTGPDATPPVKALFALKGRNAIVVAPHPRTRRSTELVVDVMRAACAQVGAPEDLVQSLPEPSLPKTQELQLLRLGQGRLRQRLHEVLGSPHLRAGRAHHVHDQLGRPPGPRMRRHDDGVTPLEREQRLDRRRGIGAGGRDQRRDHPDRLGDLDQSELG